MSLCLAALGGRTAGWRSFPAAGAWGRTPAGTFRRPRRLW